jgi:polar amino acid transport system permease protein
MAVSAGYLGLILDGAWITAQLTVFGCMLAVVAAFTAGLGRLAPAFPIRAAATAYIEFFRDTSIFVQLFWAYFVLPLMGIPLTPFLTILILYFAMSLLISSGMRFLERRMSAGLEGTRS